MITIVEALRSNNTLQELGTPSYPPEIEDRIRSIEKEIKIKRRNQEILQELTVW